MHWRAACLFLAVSTASGVFVGSPSASARRAASGTASSQNVVMPSMNPNSC